MIISKDQKLERISFCNSYGSDVDQLNNLLKLQGDKPFFFINEITPIMDRGTEYYWILYTGKFPKEESWRNKK